MSSDRAVVSVRNEILIPAAPSRVWQWLCRATRWPEWYSNCSWIRIRDDSGPDLKLNTPFVWKTFGVRVRSVVKVFEPYSELGWDATAFGLRAFHGWEITPTDDGCRVITEERQVGALTTMGRWYLRRALLREHQNWLESLRRMSIGGDPG
jgi:polyketide cyclase/dehydrase/lipid transport protein